MFRILFLGLKISYFQTLASINAISYRMPPPYFVLNFVFDLGSMLGLLWGAIWASKSIQKSIKNQVVPT